MDRKPTPAGADLQQVMLGPQVQPVENGLVLSMLGRGQILGHRLEHGRRVGHRLVQPQLVERIAQIVVRLDVTTAAGLGIGTHGVERTPHPVHQRVAVIRPPIVFLVEH